MPFANFLNQKLFSHLNVTPLLLTLLLFYLFHCSLCFKFLIFFFLLDFFTFRSFTNILYLRIPFLCLNVGMCIILLVNVVLVIMVKQNELSNFLLKNTWVVSLNKRSLGIHSLKIQGTLVTLLNLLALNFFILNFLKGSSLSVLNL